MSSLLASAVPTRAAAFTSIGSTRRGASTTKSTSSPLAVRQ
ncbi:MAG TPA: hypothetical protein VGK89_14720 [Candidatus Eisenbacteria bacterium]|jgi:hypothetical protein